MSTAAPPSTSEPHVHDRISARIGGIAESATLAVDAKAKALKAAGRPVIGFGAGEPDFPTPAPIVAAAQAACADPKNHRYTPAAGLPELRAAIAEKTAARQRPAITAGQVLVTNGGKQAVYQAFADAGRPRRRGAAARAVLDDLPRGDHAGRRRAGRRHHRAGRRLPALGRPARGRPHPAHEGAAVVLAVQPDGLGRAPGAHRGRGPVGGRERRLGRSPTRSTSTSSTTAPRRSPCRSRCPSWPTPASCSTEWPRRTR